MTTRIAGVMVRGRWLQAGEIRTMLERIAAANRQVAAPGGHGRPVHGGRG